MNDKEKIEMYKSSLSIYEHGNDMLKKENEYLKETIKELKKAKDRNALIAIGSGEFRGTELGEAVEGETLYLFPSYHHKDNVGQINTQNIIIAPVNGMVYLGTYQAYHDKLKSNGGTSFWFTREEVMILIKALAEAVAMIERGEG